MINSSLALTAANLLKKFPEAGKRWKTTLVGQ